MSNRTYVCLKCKKSYRRDAEHGDMQCPICQGFCEYVDWKIRIPSPKRKKQWRDFWEKYRSEKRLVQEFYDNPNLKQVELEILNKTLIKLD